MPRDLTKSLQRSLIHLKPPAVRGGKFASPIPTHFRTSNKFVQVKDRIPYWNFAPGDKVIVVKGGSEVRNKSGVIDFVDRESNRVYLKEPEFKVKKRAPAEYPGQVFNPDYNQTDVVIYAPRAFHVSNVRLQLQVKGQTYTACRIISGAKSWDRRYRRFSWQRAGVFTKLISVDNPRGRYNIPWVREPVPKVSEKLKSAEWDGKLKTPWTPSLSSLLSSLSLSQASRSSPSSSSASSPFSSITPSITSVPLKGFSTTMFPTSQFPNRLISSLSSGMDDGVPELKVNNLDLRKGYYSRANRTKRFNEKREEERKFGRGIRMMGIKERRSREETVEVL